MSGVIQPRAGKTRRPRPSKHVHTRVWYTAAVRWRRDGEALLEIRPGSRRMVIKRDTGATVIDYKEPTDRLEVTRGDVLLAFGPSIAETLSADVLDTDVGCGIRVRLHGDLAESTVVVSVLKLALDRGKKRAP